VNSSYWLRGYLDPAALCVFYFGDDKGHISSPAVMTHEACHGRTNCIKHLGEYP
jgi:hypothetical protein